MHIAFLLFPGVTQLDLTGPAQFLSRLPGARVDLVWETLDPVPTDADARTAKLYEFALAGPLAALADECFPASEASR